VERTEAAWRRDIEILAAEHKKLRDVVVNLAADRLNKKNFHLIRGAAAHDFYHAGQIRLLRRLSGN
jgi:hypothetical protein